jgi:hypothetical protein
VKDSTDPSGAFEQSIRDTAKSFPSSIYANIFLPKKIYEATLFILGAVYIGIDHTPMVGYLAVGLSCIFAGVTVNSTRCRLRSKSKKALA